MTSRAGALDAHKVHSQEGKHETILIRGRQLNVIGRLGEGAYSVVFLVQDPHSLRRYALKRLAVKRDEDLPKLIEEMERTERLSHHPFICACYAYEIARVEGVNYAAMLLQHGGNPLVTLMKDKQVRGERFAQSDVVRLALQIGSAVSYMHHQDPPIAHRDIKAENVMESRGVFRLVDFGSASTVAYEPRTANEFLRVQGEVSSQTTLAYRAPEMCDVYRKHRIDQRVDVWALGVLMYYVMYFELPFEETNLAILGGNLKFPGVTAQHPQHYDEPLLQCIRNCLTQNPQERWSVDDMIKFLSDAFPEDAGIVYEIMDSMKDDENPNLIKSNWSGASDGLTQSGKKKIEEEENNSNKNAPQFHSLICPGEMAVQDVSPLCSTGAAGGGDAGATDSNSSNQQQQPSWMKEGESNKDNNNSSAEQPKKNGGGGGLFGKLKWQQDGGAASTSSPTINGSSNNNNSNNHGNIFAQAPNPQTINININNNNNKPSSATADDIFGFGPSTSTTTTVNNNNNDNNRNLFTSPPQQQQQSSSSSSSQKKPDPFASLFN